MTTMTLSVRCMYLGLILQFTTYVTQAEDKCPGIEDKDIKTFDIKLPNVSIPTTNTFYICQKFKVPDDQVYHAVTFEPLISSPGLIHHMLVFGCEMDVDDVEPHECSAEDIDCGAWLTQWSIGVKGQICLPEGTGVRFGKGVYSYVSIQVHFDNSHLQSNVLDSSGFRIYYTNKLKAHDIGNVQIGQQEFQIKPRDITTTSGGCSSLCTSQMLPYPIYITRSHIHMHRLGIGGALEVYREGHKISEVARDTDYHYRHPPVHHHSPPVKVLPGDEIRLTCTYDSKNGDRVRNQTMYFGKGADGEMCYAFISYFPKVRGFNQCLQFAKYNMNCFSPTEPFIGGCVFEDLRRKAIGFASDIRDSCENINSTQCRNAVGTLTNHPCMQEGLVPYSERNILNYIPEWKELKKLLN